MAQPFCSLFLKVYILKLILDGRCNFDGPNPKGLFFYETRQKIQIKFEFHNIKFKFNLPAKETKDFFGGFHRKRSL